MLKNNRSKMHGLSDIGSNVPAFLIKLWKLVNDPETDEIICWSESGLSFIILQPARFARELLSMYYKHNNMASFIRQLNMYGFHKITSEAGGLKNDKDWMEFAHQCFVKDHPYLSENIKRKLPNPKSGVLGNEQFTNTNTKNGTQSEILAKVLSDVNNLKGKQETWDAKLASMKRENEALWRELAVFRQKHMKQEQIINRLIHFIVTMVQPSRNVSLRRRYPLMLNDIQPVKKITKLSGAGDSANINHGSPTGPTIHEIDTTDVLFKNPEESEITLNEVEFISSDLIGNTQNLMEIEKNDETPAEVKEPVERPEGGIIENIPEDWLEIEMTEGDFIDPLTPIDPAKVNPAMAAATLQHLKGVNKTTPISITIPSVTKLTDSGKKNITEKKVIYLTDGNTTQKSLKRKKPVLLKRDINRKSSKQDEDMSSPPFSTNSIVDLVLKNDTNFTKPLVLVPSNSIGKKKILSASPAVDTVLASNKSRMKNENEDEKNSSGDTFLKLDSLYNGTICEDQLAIDSPKETSDENHPKVRNLNSLVEDELPPESLDDSNEFISSKEDSKNVENEINFEPESMAIVCQQPTVAENLARELNSHVESVQGEIDYLKEMLKGEGYTFDSNNLPWIFNDDPLPFGVLSTVEDENVEKKNEETGISGNELMAYGAPNLMDLVDMMGSTPNNQEWANVFSPVSPTVTDLTTPLPSPSALSFSNPAKKRKK